MAQVKFKCFVKVLGQSSNRECFSKTKSCFEGSSCLHLTWFSGSLKPQIFKCTPGSVTSGTHAL